MDFALAFMDCEFGGLDPRLHDITEIAVITTDYRLVELGAREWKVAARADRITPEAAQISGYSPEAWRDALPLPQVLSELTGFLPTARTLVPAGQNVRMDVHFLELAHEKCGIRYPFDYHVIDLATLFYAWSLVTGEPVTALSLRQAATTAGLIDGAVPHRAMADARLTLEAFRYYVGRLAPRRVGEPGAHGPAPDLLRAAAQAEPRD